MKNWCAASNIGLAMNLRISGYSAAILEAACYSPEAALSGSRSFLLHG
jgi:hypothetical protein